MAHEHPEKPSASASTDAYHPAWHLFALAAQAC